MPDQMKSDANFSVNPSSYRLVVSGAHRKPPPLIGAPALILHYALWQPDLDAASWHLGVDLFLCNVFRILRGEICLDKELVSPNYDYEGDNLYLFRHVVKKISDIGLHEMEWISSNYLEPFFPERINMRYDVFSVRTVFHGINLTVRAELYSEFFTLSFTSDFDIINGNRSEVNPYAKDFFDIYQLIKALFKSHAGKDIVDIVPSNSSNRLKQINRTLHRRFRDVITDKIIKKSIKSLGNGNEQLLGTVFGEFHGAVFGLQPSFRGLTSIDVGDTPAKPKTRTIQSQVGTHKFSNDVATRVVDAMWPLIKEIQRYKDQEEKDEGHYGKPEFTATLFQDRRSIYISSLGWLDPRLESQEVRPIVYTLVVSYRSRWALGRLIERMHMMGTLRLAAMRDIEKITSAGEDLKSLEETLRQAEERLNTSGSLHQELNGTALAQQCLATGSHIKFGLMHRVERSKYYWHEFERILNSSRCGRIEGFQPYDQFVNRRMYATFDYIQRVGERYKELRQEIDLILRKNNATKINTIVSKLEENADETNDLLDSAEYIIAAPLVYYLGHIFMAIISVFLPFLFTVIETIPWPRPAMTLLNGWHSQISPDMGDYPIPQVIAYLFALLCVLVGLRRLRHGRQQSKLRRTRRPTT
jgi:hypothetical protein